MLWMCLDTQLKTKTFGILSSQWLCTPNKEHRDTDFRQNPRVPWIVSLTVGNAAAFRILERKDVMKDQLNCFLRCSDMVIFVFFIIRSSTQLTDQCKEKDLD